MQHTFPKDIYGGGPDLDSIKRAFLHRVLGKRKDVSNNVDLDLDPEEEHDTQRKDDSDNDDVDMDGEEHGTKEGHEDSFYRQLSDAVTSVSPNLLDEINEEDSHELTPITSKDKIDTTTASKTTPLQTLKDSMTLVKKLPKDKLSFKFPKSRYEFRKNPIPARFLGPKEHSLLKTCPSKIFCNPSITEVLCTTTAEALAMGKFVILPFHPSNKFFYQFPNCLAYKDMDEFVKLMQHAMTNEPETLSAELRYCFTWDAAMERLVTSAAITEKDHLNMKTMGRLKRDERKAYLHKESGRFMKGEVLRGLVGNPPQENLADYLPDDTNSLEKNEIFLSFDSSSPKIICAVSFALAILSYFLQS